MSHILANGVKTYIQRLGAGDKKIVFVHGLVLDNLSSFYFTLANPLAQYADVLLYDLRGHGKSDRPATNYDLATLLADLHAVINDQFPNEKVYVAGNSFGGLMALTYAIEHPEKTAGLILVDPLLPLAGWREDMVTTLTLEKNIVDRLYHELYKNWHAKESERKKQKLKDTVDKILGDTSILADIAHSKEYAPQDISNIACPAIAVYGAESNILDSGHKLKALAPHVDLQIVPESTHLILFENTEKLKDLVIQWLTQQR